jgi:hypothetical protein
MFDPAYDPELNAAFALHSRHHLLICDCLKADHGRGEGWGALRAHLSGVITSAVSFFGVKLEYLFSPLR